MQIFTLSKTRYVLILPSVSSLLTARESDPEDVLKGAGFRGPTVLDKIPDRFINTGTVCDGVDSEQFLYSVQDDSENAMSMVSQSFVHKLVFNGSCCF